MGAFSQAVPAALWAPVQGTRLAELAHLPFHSTVHEYGQRYNTVLCHAHDLSPWQKAELFVGGWPEHIKVDVEIRHPPDLQTVMYLARRSNIGRRHSCRHSSHAAAGPPTGRGCHLYPDRCRRHRGGCSCALPTGVVVNARGYAAVPLPLPGRKDGAAKIGALLQL